MSHYSDKFHRSRILWLAYCAFWTTLVLLFISSIMSDLIRPTVDFSMIAFLILIGNVALSIGIYGLIASRKWALDDKDAFSKSWTIERLLVPETFFILFELVAYAFAGYLFFADHTGIQERQWPFLLANFIGHT